MNAYKVWSGEGGYMIVLADTPTNAKLEYWSNFMSPPSEMFGAGADMRCHLIEKDVESRNVREYEKSRYYDLIFAGITHPEWAEELMAYDWRYDDQV